MVCYPFHKMTRSQVFIIGEALPEAEILLAAAQGLDIATTQMQEAVNAWEPTFEDAFIAMVTMIPTMNEYFEHSSP